MEIDTNKHVGITSADLHTQKKKGKKKGKVSVTQPTLCNERERACVRARTHAREREGERET